MRSAYLRRGLLASAMILLVGYLAHPQAGRSLLVLPVERPEDVSPETALMIEDVLVTALLSGGSFELSARERSSVALEDTQGALDRARAAKSGFVLLSRLKSEGRKGTDRLYALTIRLIAADTGKELYGRTTKFEEKAAGDVLMDLAKRIAVAARTRSDVTVELIETFAKAKDWEAARRFLAIYLDLHPADKTKLAPLSARINTGLASIRNLQAREAAALSLYEEALSAARASVELAPGVPEYTAYLKTLEEDYAAYLAQSDAQRLDAVEDFFRKGKIDVAAVLLERSGNSARSSARGRNLAGQIERSLKARAAALDAERYLMEYQFPLALASIDEALRLQPDTASYIKLRIRIVEAEKREAATRERFEVYKDELRSFDYASLFVSRKAMPTGFGGSLGLLWISLYDPSTSSWEPLKRGPFPELRIQYSSPIPVRTSMPFSFMDTTFQWFGAASASYGVERTEEPFPVVLVEGRTTYLFLGGGASASLEVLSFALRADAGLDVAWMRYTQERTDPVTGPLGTGSEHTWSLCFGVGASVLWSPVRDMAVRLGMYRTTPFLSSADLSNGAPGAVSFRLGLEFDLP